MANAQLGTVLRHLRQLAAARNTNDTCDAALLGAFADRKDETAFAALVHRHGPLVLAVCRRVLRHEQDAEDAFQATFLALAKNAASVRKKESLAGWLHGVAYRVAVSAGRVAARRQRHEKQAEMAKTQNPATEAAWREVQQLLDEEVQRLPETYREPFVLCCLENHSCAEAARRLGVKEGTVWSRLAEARKRLGKRLDRRGVSLTALLIAAALVQEARAVVPAVLASSAAHAAGLVATGKTLTMAAASTRIAALAEGVTKTMFLSKLGKAMVLLLALGALGGGGLLTYQSGSQANPASAPEKSAEAKADADARAIRDLIKQLGNKSFQKREAASQRLVAIGEPALEPLKQAARDNTDPEIRQRAAAAAREIERTLFTEVRRFEGHQGEEFRRWVGRVGVTPDGRKAVSAGFDALRCWDLAGGKQTLAFGDNKAGYWSLAISPDGKRAIAGSNDRVARVFDLVTGNQVQQLVGHTGEVWAVAFSADGKQAVTGAWDQSLRVWDIETGKELRAFEEVRGHVRCLALSPDGKQVVAGHFTEVGKPAMVRLWDAETGKEIRAFEGHTQEVSSVAFSPDGKMLLSSGFDKTVRLWDAASGKELKRLEGHTWRVEYAAFTPDGKRVLSGGNERDPVLRLWDVASGKQLLESEAVDGGFLSLAVLPDSRHCVTTGKDGVVRLWRWTR